MALSVSHVQVSCTTCSCPRFLCQTYPGSCCELSQQGAAPALPSTLIPAGIQVEFGPFEASLSLGAARVTLQGGMEVPWPPIPRSLLGAPLPLWRLRSRWSHVLLVHGAHPCCPRQAVLCVDMAALPSVPQCTHPNFRWLCKGCSCPCRNHGEGWQLGLVLPRCHRDAGWAPGLGCAEAPSPPAQGCRGARGWGLQHQPWEAASPARAPAWELGHSPAAGFGKGPAGSNTQPTSHSSKNKPRGEISIFARCIPARERGLAET